MDLISSSTRIRTAQLTEGSQILIENGFMLTDVIINSTSKGFVTLVARDNEHTHIITQFKGQTNFNHAFPNGWSFWNTARLEIIKESEDGIVNISVGVVKLYNAFNYEQWNRRL